MENRTIKVRKVGFSYRFIKRFADIFISLMAIVFLSWLYLLISILVICFSGWPIIYKDERIGKNGKKFHCLKFRTMKRDANKNVEEYLTKDELDRWNKERKVEKDPRVTKIGRFLRKTSLDELPQFFNIFLGQMSIIGPRPITSSELNEHFNEEERKIIISVRPGLFSNWSVHGRNNINFDSGLRQKYELEYFEKRSIFFELKMFFKIIFVVLSTKGAR